MVRAQYRAPFSSSFPYSRHFAKNPCYSLTANFREILLADVSGILTIRKVINHGNPRWCVSSLVDVKRSQRLFRTKEDSAMKRILWDSEQPLTIARVTNRGNISVIGGFGQKSTCKTCKRNEEETGINGTTAHPIFSLHPLEFVRGTKSVTNPTT